MPLNLERHINSKQYNWVDFESFNDSQFMNCCWSGGNTCEYLRMWGRLLDLAPATHNLLESAVSQYQSTIPSIRAFEMKQLAGVTGIVLTALFTFFPSLTVLHLTLAKDQGSKARHHVLVLTQFKTWIILSLTADQVQPLLDKLDTQDQVYVWSTVM